MRNLRGIAFQALFLSLAAHIIILSFFSFRIPLKNIPMQPFVNFLGSFLKPYDTQAANKNPPQLNLNNREIATFANQLTTNPHIKTETPRSFLFLSLPTSTKKTLPHQKIDPAAASQDPTAADPNMQNDEPFQYTPLRLPEHDHY